MFLPYMPFAILALWPFADFTIFVFASAFALFFLSSVLMCNCVIVLLKRLRAYAYFYI